MKVVTTSALAFALAGTCSLAAPASAAGGFADVICPQAAQYVIAAGKLRVDDPPQRVYDAAQAATNAYERCSQEKLGNGYHEAQHYADVRASGFAVVAARALIAMNRLGDAKSELEHWRPLAQQVVDWRQETETYASADVNGSSTTVAGANNWRSLYAQAAGEVVTAIDAQLAIIAQRTAGATPAPAPTAGHLP